MEDVYDGIKCFGLDKGARYYYYYYYHYYYTMMRCEIRSMMREREVYYEGYSR